LPRGGWSAFLLTGARSGYHLYYPSNRRLRRFQCVDLLPEQKYCMRIQYYSGMGLKPPIPTEQLHAIQERNRDSADILTLLWEIKRMRATLLYADQLQRMLTTLPRPQGAILDTCATSSRTNRV